MKRAASCPYLTLAGTGFGLMLFFVGMNVSASAKELKQRDTTSVFNFYNPPGNFIVQPEHGLKVDEHEMRAGLMYDLENKKIVWQKEMDMPFPIASLTKMMVALITVEDIHAGRIHWTDNVHWTREIVTGRGKKKRTTTEEINYSLYDLFKAAMIASNNEAAEQIAGYVGGDVSAFVDRMNTRARELGMNSTFYGNPTGLPANAKAFDNSASPSDLLLLTLEMLQYNEILQVTGLGYTDIGNGKNTCVIRNHNHLTIDFKGEVDGMKTGYTRRAGFCLSATSNKCDHRLISIVLGARSPALRNEVVKDMINDYYSSIGLDKLGPYCEAPKDATAGTIIGDFMYRTRTVKNTHVVKRGEDLESVAYQYNCSVQDLKKWNNLRSNRMKPGRNLIIEKTLDEKIPVAKNSDEDGEGSNALSASPAQEEPVVKEAPAKAPAPNPKTVSTSPPAKSKYIIYVVQPGDTLFSIARRYELSDISELKAVNKITRGHLLKAGTKIKVPVSG